MSISNTGTADLIVQSIKTTLNDDTIGNSRIEVLEDFATNDIILPPKSANLSMSFRINLNQTSSIYFYFLYSK